MQSSSVWLTPTMVMRRRFWGPYLNERQWGTVREDHSPDGEAWNYFSHEHARSHANSYRLITSKN